MTKLADIAARLRALTELDSTLLVEAAAGTGKTALMAGRVTMLLANGAEPGSIAAITFTELAASALGLASNATSTISLPGVCQNRCNPLCRRV